MLRETEAFCLIEGLALTNRTIMKMRDKSSKERLITKERRPLTVPRKISSGTGLISIVGRDGSSKGSLGNSISEYARRGREGYVLVGASRACPQTQDSSTRERAGSESFPVCHDSIHFQAILPHPWEQVLR